MARTVEDAVAVFQVIVGADPDDSATIANAGGLHGPGWGTGAKLGSSDNYAASLVKDGLHGARIGVLRQAYERDTTDPEIVQVFTAAVEDLKHSGAFIIDPAPIDLSKAVRPQGGPPCGGFKYDMNRYLAALGDKVPVHSVEEIIKSRRFHPSVQRRLEQAQEGVENGPDTPACKAEAEYRQLMRVAVMKTMDTYKLDAFVYPTWSNPPRLIGDLNTPHGDNSQVFSPATGFPSIQVPMGYTRGTLPAGLTFFGRAWDEARLIKLAYGYEQATTHRRPPASTPPLR